MFKNAGPFQQDVELCLSPYWYSCCSPVFFFLCNNVYRVESHSQAGGGVDAAPRLPWDTAMSTMIGKQGGKQDFRC